MRTASDKLFTLIKSLTKNEKRYFKCFSQMHELKDGNKYVQLFDAIEKQDEYDEAFLKKKFINESFIKYFSAEKAYLYNLIVRSLSVYGSGYDVYEQTVELFLQARILYKKDLYTDALEYLSKAKKNAVEGEWYTLLIEIEKLETTIVYNSKNVYSLEKINVAYQNMCSALENEKEIIDAKHQLNLISFKIAHSDKSRTEKDVQEIKKNVEVFFSNNENTSRSITYQKIKSSALAQLHYYLDDPKKGFEETKKVMELSSTQKKTRKGDYYNSLFNHFNLCMQTKKFEEAEKTMKKIEELEITSIVGQKKYEKSMFWAQLLLYSLTSQFDKAKEFALSKEKVISAIWKTNPSPELLVGISSAAMVFFVKEDYSNCIKWLNRFFFMKDSPLTQRIDLIENAALLYMMVHYELKNDELIHQSVKPLQKKLESEFAKKALKFIGRILVQSKTKRKPKTSFVSIKTELMKTIKNESEPKFIESLFFMKWVESKIKGISLEAYLIENSHN